MVSECAFFTSSQRVEHLDMLVNGQVVAQDTGPVPLRDVKPEGVDASGAVALTCAFGRAMPGLSCRRCRPPTIV